MKGGLAVAWGALLLLTAPHMSCCCAGEDCKRLQRWWELAPPDAADSSDPVALAAAAAAALAETAPAANVSSSSSSSAQQGAGVAVALSELHCGTRRTRSTADLEQLSNITAVPGTSLLFDRRSLRARKPSVRFRNTGERDEHIDRHQVLG